VHKDWNDAGLAGVDPKKAEEAAWRELEKERAEKLSDDSRTSGPDNGGAEPRHDCAEIPPLLEARL
jgi:hypothetical protein